MVRKSEALATLEIGFPIRFFPLALTRDGHPHHDSWDVVQAADLFDEVVESRLGAGSKRIDDS